MCMDWIRLAQERPVMGSCEHGNKPSGFTECLEIEWLSDWWFLKKDSASWS
jgi:hypothetical protein